MIAQRDSHDDGTERDETPAYPPPPGVPLHMSLVSAEGGLKPTTRDLPALRAWVEGLPPTKATFNVREVGSKADLEHDPWAIPTVIVEWCRAWPMSQHYKRGTETQVRFVNPGYVHAPHYPEVIAECECGTAFIKDHDCGDNWIRDQHNHADDCKPQWRLRARARLAEWREDMLVRLMRMGWEVRDIAPRTGIPPNSLTSMAARHGLSRQELRDEFKERAGNTYGYLVGTCGEDRHTVADLYDCSTRSLARWASGHGAYEYEGAEWVCSADGEE